MSNFVDSAERAEENRSSAWTLTLVGGIGLIVIILNLLNVIHLPFSGFNKYMVSGLMGALFIIFIIAGIISVKKTKTYSKAANVEKDNKAKIIDALAAIHVVVIAVLYALQIFDIADFTHSVIIFHILMFTEIFVLAIINYLVMAKKAIKRALQLLPYILLGTSFVIDFNMFLHNSDHTWTLARIWVYLYLLNTIRQYAKFFLTDAVDAIESKYLKEIAYTDILTGIKNRNAFVSELQTSNLETSSIISFDVNGLKYYNDNFGHDKGDELLTSMSDALKKVFDESVYRMGGDEFIVLLDTVDKGKIVEMLEKFENEIEAFNKQNKIVLQSAYGYSIYEKGKTYDDMIKEADKNMYICKRKQKGIN